MASEVVSEENIQKNRAKYMRGVYDVKTAHTGGRAIKKNLINCAKSTLPDELED